MFCVVQNTWISESKGKTAIPFLYVSLHVFVSLFLCPAVLTPGPRWSHAVPNTLLIDSFTHPFDWSHVLLRDTPDSGDCNVSIIAANILRQWKIPEASLLILLNQTQPQKDVTADHFFLFDLVQSIWPGSVRLSSTQTTINTAGIDSHLSSVNIAQTINCCTPEKR